MREIEKDTVEVLVEGQADLVEQWFNEDPRRGEALDLRLQGVMTSEQIAKELGIGRATYFRWVRHPAFMARLKATIEETMINRKLRRFRMTTNFTNYLGVKIEHLIKEEVDSITRARVDPSHKVVDNTPRISKVLADYRAMRQEERLDGGEAEQRVHLHVEQETDHAQQLKNPFIDVLQNLLGDGHLKETSLHDSLGLALDADYEEIDAGQALIALTEVALQDTPLLEDFGTGQPSIEVKRNVPRILRKKDF